MGETRNETVIESWRIHYNTKRPHYALGYRPPAPLSRASSLDEAPSMN
jgi:transposase InsO family protein